MKRSVKKIVSMTAVAVVLLIASAAIGANWMGERKAHRVVKLEVAPVAFVDGPDAIARGKYLYDSRGCMECHGAQGAGRVVVDDPNGMHIRSPDITTGTGGVVAGYTESDWVRTIRHGITPQGHAVFLMPSEDYNRLTDADLAALVAYVRSLPPVAGEERVIKNAADGQGTVWHRCDPRRLRKRSTTRCRHRCRSRTDPRWRTALMWSTCAWAATGRD
ncbi:c-type cytochrome [Undibacterium arcticum]